MSGREVGKNWAAAGDGARAGGTPVTAIVIGVMALAIVAVAAFVFLQAARPEPPVGAGSATPSASAPPTVPASTTAEPSPSSTPEPTAAREWEMARVVERRDDPSTGATFMGVQWHEGPGWIAFGTQQNHENGLPGVWTSDDGKSWTLADLPSGLEGSPIRDIAHGDVDGVSRFVALGGADGRSRILTSDDGSIWELATTPETPTGIHALAYGPAGFVATGSLGNPGERQRSGPIWQSSDGLEWRESTPPALERALAFEIAVLGDRYVAAGFPDVSGPPLLAWVSTDAAAWSEYEVSPPSGVGCLCLAVDATGGRMVVLGTSEDAYAALSDDGESWTHEVLEAETSVILTGADVVDDGAVVATGRLNIADGPRDALIWVRDADASEWRAVDWRAELPDVREDEIGLGGSLYVAVGPERTLILLSDGTVFLTADRLP